MTFAIGGAARPRKTVKEAATVWKCACGNPEGRTSRRKLNRAYLVRCPDCGTRRPG